jgi:serine/threonine-protein kinase RsbW
MINQKQSVEIFIPSELGYEKVAISAVASLADRMGFPGERIDDLKTALGEAVTNAIEHGNQLNVDLNVQVIAQVDQKALTLTIIDQGHRPLPPLTPVRQDRADHRGWGLWLMQNLVDEVKAVVMPRRNELELVMYRA